MNRFTQLYLELDRTTKTTVKVDALRRYFADADDDDAAWALYFLIGGRVKRAVNYRQLRDWAAELSGYPVWLIDECYETVGDLSETIALLLPAPRAPINEPLADVAEQRIAPLPALPDDRKRALLRDTWSNLPAAQRLVFNKLMLGGFRVGASKKLVTRALAEYAQVDPAVMTHRLTGAWKPAADAFRALLQRDDHQTQPAQPYPFFLASPWESAPDDPGDVDDWQIEWKWDGIRAQLIRRQGKTILWSRGEDLINASFPELIQAAQRLPEATVLDGEILAWENGRALPFNLLQRRLGRKNVEPSFWPDVPVVFMVFDLLEHAGSDMRSRPLSERRAQLGQLCAAADTPHLQLSAMLKCTDWSQCERMKDAARDHGAEGVMLKRKQSPYGVGRTRGDWWKWKVDPHTIDAVLIYAQPGHGRRANLFTDYTFGVWDGDQLVPVAKAYSGLTAEEIQAVDRRVRETTVDRKGPVRFVKPEMVFELAFEGIASSSRHRSGIALRFPRMARWRVDKTPAEADTIQTLRNLLDKETDRPRR